MRCFHFSSADEEAVPVPRAASRVSWARSLSAASAARSEVESDAAAFHNFLSQRRARDLRAFGFSELKSATRGFSRSSLIGEGGFGCVFRGAVRVEDGGDGRGAKMDVAVKQLNRNGFQGHKEWMNEVNLLGVVKHPNLVKLVGYCAEDDERGIQRLLVYELMQNKSLEDHLLTRAPSPPLPWMVRLRIAQDAARGLAYLHEEMDFQLIFRDFKASNILLDEHFNARLSDFGLARQGPAEGNGHVSTSVVGTVGYAAPEYVQTGKLTAKSDVWSFGVVLYELITGRRAVERNLPKGEQKLLEWVRPYISDSRKFHLIIDPRLDQPEQCSKSAQKVSSLANKCLMKNPKSRPKMSEVVAALGDIIGEIEPRDEVNQDVQAESNNGSQCANERVLDLRDMASLRNKSTRKLDWRSWTTGLAKTR
uniref:non-specific serine/threonine protein kinase n=2 Tax=Kalanchoe fedtschenkoi TaxID=63787 RepID=A0A7N0UIU7_KALFE